MCLHMVIPISLLQLQVQRLQHGVHTGQLMVLLKMGLLPIPAIIMFSRQKFLEMFKAA